MGFTDFAGSTIVHSTGGWAALAGMLVIGPRLGKFRKDGSVRATPPSNILIVTLGVFILWFGWFGFNGGSQLALGSAKDAVSMSIVLVNTNLAAAAGVMAALAASRPLLGRTDLFAGLNGAIAGLVSITAAPNFTDHYWAVIIGAIGGVICVAGLKLLEKVKLDDVVGAVPAHLFAGVWGTLAAAIAGGAQFHVQLIGVLAIGVFVFAVSFALWKLIDITLSARVTHQVERLGQDAGELGMESYPEFVLMPDPDDELTGLPVPALGNVRRRDGLPYTFTSFWRLRTPSLISPRFFRFVQDTSPTYRLPCESMEISCGAMNWPGSSPKPSPRRAKRSPLRL